MLDHAQITQYFRDGFVVERGLFKTEELSAWSDCFEQIVSGDRPLAKGMVLMQDVMVAKKEVTPRTPLHAINKLLNFEDDPLLYSYVQHEKLTAIAHELIGADSLHSLVTNVFNKPPDVDGRHPLHQDLRYFRLRPARQIVAAWTAISPANEETGGLDVVPGSHHGPLLPHELPNWEYLNYAFYGVESHVKYEHKSVALEPGDTIFFHPLLIHGSGRNRSDTFRRAISTHYASGACVSPLPDWRDNDRVRTVAT